jgi:hypothetical protein
MAAQLCQKCKQCHPGRVVNYDEKGECAETVAVHKIARPYNEPYRDEEDWSSFTHRKKRNSRSSRGSLTA